MATKKTTPEVEAVITAEIPVVVTEETTTEKPKATAKAGKRSEKAIKETEEKEAKEERKAAGDTSPTGEAKVAQKQNPTRSRLERRGKNYRKVVEGLDLAKAYSLKEAVELAAKTSVG